MNLSESELQITLEMDNNLVMERTAKANIKINSTVEKEATLSFFLKSENDEILSEGEKKIQLKVGLNEVSFTMGFAPESRIFKVNALLDNNLELKHLIYRLSPFELSNLEKKISKYGKNLDEGYEGRKFHDLKLKLNELNELIQDFDPKASPIQVKERVEELNQMLE